MHFPRVHREGDMTRGPLLPQILLFALPLILSNILQLLFNAADVIVVGRFAADGVAAQAAVGSTGALINMIINLFLGLSIGANVVVARAFGAGDYKSVSDAVHTAILSSLVSGVILAVFGFFMSETFLIWMDTTPETLELATLYMQIYFIGMPVNMLYNFGAAILRAVGDTRRPLIYLTLAGIINVFLNLFFVIVFHMDVAGVALATITSQAVSAVLVLICLCRTEGAIQVNLKRLHINRKQIVEIVRIGIPAGIQGVFFSLSNVMIQSTVNKFGYIDVAGNTVSSNIEGFIYNAMNAIYQAAITFTSQNVGARMYARVRRVCVTCVLTVTAVGLLLGGVALLFQDFFLNIYNSDPNVIAAGERRLWIIATTYFTCGIMDVLCGSLRGLGSTVLPMIVSLAGACAFRILWIWFVMPLSWDLKTLYISYPISWVLTAGVHAICYAVMLKKFPVSAGADALKSA